MQVCEGYSQQGDAADAIAEATSGWPEGSSFVPEMIFVFHSMAQDTDAVTLELSARFPGALIAGCTTAGEWSSGRHHNGALVLTAIASPNIRWSIHVVESLANFSAESARIVYDSLLGQLQIDRSDLTPKRHFCIGLTDGIAGVDGSAVAEMGAELGNVPFLGGVAGDDLKFEKTYVIANDQAYAGGAVFIFAESEIPFRQIKHQHFIPGEHEVVITSAIEPDRKVLKLDGMPAAERYAQLIGCKVKDLDFQMFSEHPLIYHYGNDDYVRTIFSADDDGSLSFYCTIEEGMVLNLCEHRDMTFELNKEMKNLLQDHGHVQLLFLCNCSFRSLEAEGKNLNQGLAEITGSVAEHVVGFDTYGELWNGLHVNQTMVALAIGFE